MSTTPAGWYPDPYGKAKQRYWDGSQWTEHTSDADPAGAAGGAQAPQQPQQPASPAPAGGPVGGPIGGTTGASPGGGGGGGGRGKRILAIVGGIIGLLVIAFVVLVLVLPTKIDGDKVEDELRKRLDAAGQSQITKVECPDGEPADKGHTFDCTITANDGSTAPVKIEVIDEDGTVRIVGGG